MPTAEFVTKDLMGLIGKNVPLEEFEERASMLGTSVEEVSAQKVVIEVFPNRPDMLSVEGFARAYRTFTGLDSGLKNYEVNDSDITLNVDSKVKEVRPFVMAAIVKNLPVTENVLLSIIAIQEALHKSHGRRRRKVAIGVHDFDATKPPYSYSASKPNDASFIPLDYSVEMDLEAVLTKHPKGKDYAHILEGKPVYPLVLDQEGIVSLPPIINADRTRVKEGASNLFVEMTGTNKLALKHTMGIILSSLADRGGTIVSIKVDGKSLDISPEIMTLDVSYANKLLGISLSEKEAISLLLKMGYDAKDVGKGKLDVSVPCYRADVLAPIDLIEDIAIAYGYENFVPEEPNIATTGAADPLEEKMGEVRALMIGLGFREALNFILTKPETIESAGKITGNPVKIKNPRTEEFTMVRTSIIPSLLSTLALNKKKKIPQKIFEIDNVVPGETNPENKKMLGITWLDAHVNFSQMQSVVEGLLSSMGTTYVLKENEHPSFIPGRCGAITIKGKDIGYFGEVAPEVLRAFGIDYPVLLAELAVVPL